MKRNLKGNGKQTKTREIARWDFQQYHQAHMNSDGQYWDVAILFYGEEVGTATLCYGIEYDEEGPIIMNPRDSWVTDELERVELNQLDFEVSHLFNELMDALEKEYPESKKYTIGGGLYSLLLEAGIIKEEEE